LLPIITTVKTLFSLGRNIYNDTLSGLIRDLKQYSGMR
jgi:hypothetical protein